MSSTGGSAPPVFADSAKFNGSNWVSWNGLIQIAADLRGVSGYLDGTTPKPTSPTPSPLGVPLPPSPTTATAALTITAPTETPWESTTPTSSEWRVRNTWAMGLLIYNTTDPVGLGINIHGTAADAWKSYIDTYQIASEVAVLNAELDLRNMAYTDGQDFVEFISRIRTKWSNATALGANIDDKAFRTIILNSLPRSWDPIVATLYTTKSSRDAINQLMAHWARISRDRVTNPQTTTSALQTTTPSRNRERQRNQSPLQCNNPNCGRRGHTIENCYWPGGGKAGQFPAGFGRRGGMRNTNSTGQNTTANATTTTESSSTEIEPKVFALATITTLPDDPDSVVARTTYNILSGDISRIGGIPDGVNSLVSNIPRIRDTILTLLDSGASDHCFVQKGRFSDYKAISPPRTGNSAGKGSTFSIEGSGTAEFLTAVNGVAAKIVMKGCLHTPQLRSNLISVSQLVARGSRVTFEGDLAVVRNQEGRTVLIAVRRNGLYVIITDDIPVISANAAQAKHKAVGYDIWHRRLGHVATDVISRMVRESLVDGLNISGNAQLDAMCEDCIYGKHTTHPFNDEVPAETEVLERVYVDMWGPAPVESAGGAKYFMLLVDGATSYRKVYFLPSKSSDATLGVFKDYHKESERQTGKKLKRVRLDMGKEWHNALWDEYAKSNGIVLDFTTPYAHQQNGRAERSMRTLLEMARTSLADAGLPQKFWADAVQTAVYTRNFIPATRTPNHVPAEQWVQKRQDISHLRPFGTTAYAHVPTEISPSKLSPRSVKLTMIGYFDRTGYKLLDRSTGATHKSRDVIFEETRPHYSTDPIVAFPPDLHVPANAIAPRPKGISTLHPPVQQTMQPTLVDNAAGSSGSDGEKLDSEGEVAKLLDLDEEPIAVRRARREPKLSERMKDSLEYLGRARANVATVASVLDDNYVPKTFNDAMRAPELWFEPMIKELQVMKDKGVYKLVPRPSDRNVVQSRWVFANKFDGSGIITSRKARLVAKGFTQVLGEDYDETYASVARLESVRLVCAIAASLGLRLWQVDFVSAFLNSDNSYEVYMEQPPGFEEGGGDDVWLLLKTLYGTMQGAHDWAQTLEKTYQGHGYTTSRADPQVRFRAQGDEITLTSTWTDDILGASSTASGETRAKEELQSSHELKDLGKAQYILGMKIDVDETTGSIRLSQRAYVERIIERFNMSDAKIRSTPLPAGIVLSIDDAPQSAEEILEMKKVPYREALGSLMWLQVATRPDLSYAVNLLSRFSNNPGRAHWEALKHTIAYLKGTLDYGITYYRDTSLRPFGYVDADYAGDIDTLRSTEGNIFFVAGGPVSWASKRQERVSLSTVESEYTALTHATQQALWITKFMDEIRMAQELPVVVYADNTGAIANTTNNKNHRRTKHIRVKHHFTKECVAHGQVTFPYVPSAENLADILTKPLSRDAILRCCRGIGLVSDVSSKQGKY